MTIDARVRVPLDRLPDVSPERAAKLREEYGRIFQWTVERGDTAELLDSLAAHEIDRAVLHAEYEVGDSADALNEAVGQLTAEHPNRFTGVGTVSLERPNVSRMVGQVRRCAQLGFAGVNIQPAFFDLSIDERRLYPVYAAALELDLSVAIHTGVNYSRTSPIAGERPILLDRVACDFPDLRIVALHAGWPWTAEMAAVARRHPNVFLEFGGMSPKYLAVAGSGWEVLWHFMSRLLGERVLFASNWPMMDHGRSLTEWRALNLPCGVLEASLAANIVHAYALKDEPTNQA